MKLFYNECLSVIYAELIPAISCKLSIEVHTEREGVQCVCECVCVYFNILRMKYEGQLDLNEARQTPTQV